MGCCKRLSYKNEIYDVCREHVIRVKRMLPQIQLVDRFVHPGCHPHSDIIDFIFI